MNPGTKVTCINDKNLPKLVYPIKKDHAYTIREFKKGYRPEGGFAPVVYLEEIENVIYRGHEIGYDANRFAPMQDNGAAETRKESRTLEQVY